MNLCSSFITVVFFAVFNCFGWATVLGNSDKLLSPSAKTAITIASTAHNEVGRDCGINVCFAIDGSSSVNHTEFQLQKDYAQIVVSMLGIWTGSGWGALQYGEESKIIFTLTNDTYGFTLKVGHARSIMSPRRNVALGIEECMKQLGSVSQSAFKTIVIIGDGRANAHGNYTADGLVDHFMQYGRNIDGTY